MEKAPQLKPEVAEKYELGTHHTVIRRGSKVIDLTALTVAEADKLVGAGNFPYLKAKEKATAKAK
ncbi:hypothetical protein [uncultured Pontibacter sp.]|uniref:hypothetical protein n=1 Tax=uncultured Pontibacter sp. TaxID=453356 RepID=UPI002631E2E5|nr:hypothetical protein [uncultured Pontibacter sp.]